jgi:hypothetical protein
MADGEEKFCNWAKAGRRVERQCPAKDDRACLYSVQLLDPVFVTLGLRGSGQMRRGVDYLAVRSL